MVKIEKPRDKKEKEREAGNDPVLSTTNTFPPRSKTLLIVFVILATLLPRPGNAQVLFSPGARFCEANTGVSGGQESSHNTDLNQARARAEGGAAGTEKSSFAEVGLHFIPIMPMETTLRMEGIWPRGQLEGFGNINEGSYKARVILRDVTADNQLGDQTVLQNAENGDVATKKIKIINDPFNLGTGVLEADLEAGTEYALVLRLEATANGLFGLSDFLSGNRQATFTCVTTAFDDADGDGLSDQWEQSGIDVDGDGDIDLNLQALGADYNGTPMKADPNHKDIFVEVDYFDCTVAGGDCTAGDTHVHQPMAAALDLIRQSFANAPVTNPDGQTGINLWVQVDEALPHQATCDLDPPCFDAVKAGSFGTAAERANADILTGKRLVFRYNLWVHDKNAGNSSSGQAEGGGNDFVVSLGSWTAQVGTTQDQAGTFMHELGHTLGLGHGGVDGINCKPNYLSIMSYTWQVTGLQPAGIFDYSRGALPNLNENSLNEPVGIQDGAFTTFYGLPDSSGNWNLGPGTGPIDWDLDGDPTDNPGVPSDINNLGIAGCGSDFSGNPKTVLGESLKGWDDWSNLKFNFRSSADFEEGVHQTADEEEIDAETAQRIKEQTWRAQLKTVHEYTAKFVCGVQNDPKEMRLARGFYATTINIHNPNRQETTFFKKLALTYPPPEQRAGRIVPIGLDSLKDDEALKVDCVDIEKNLFRGAFPTPYIEGYIVIQSPRSLDVAGVYTSAAVDENGRATAHSSIDVEQITERVKEVGLPDLIPAAPFPKPKSGLPEGSPGVLYCVKSPAGGASKAIRVVVKNTGIVEAEASLTMVTFTGAGNATLPTPALQPGKETILEFPIPNGCYPPGFSTRCRFKITVDAALQVTESNEKNNTAQSFCAAPAG